jgi:hypothetical protein
MLLLVVELCKGGEHACDLLIVSVSMSIQNCEKMGSIPGFNRCADPYVIEIRRFYLTVPGSGRRKNRENFILIVAIYIARF